MSIEVMLTSAILVSGYALVAAPYFLTGFAMGFSAVVLAYIAYQAIKLAAQAFIALVSMVANALIETTKFVLYALAVGVVYGVSLLIDAADSIFQMVKKGFLWMTTNHASSYPVEPSAPPYVPEGYGRQMDVFSYPTPSAPLKDDVYQQGQTTLPIATAIPCYYYDPRFLSQQPPVVEAKLIPFSEYPGNGR